MLQEEIEMLKSTQKMLEGEKSRLTGELSQEKDEGHAINKKLIEVLEHSKAAVDQLDKAEVREFKPMWQLSYFWTWQLQSADQILTQHLLQ